MISALGRARVRWQVILAAIIAVVLVFGVGSVINTPKAHATGEYWSLFYDNYWHANNPGDAAERDVWSNRSPSWVVGQTSGQYNYMIFQSDCNLVVYTYTYGAAWASGTNGIGGPCKLAFQGDGNVVIYDGGGHPRWATGTWHYGNTESTDAALWWTCFNVAGWPRGTEVLRWEPFAGCDSLI